MTPDWSRSQWLLRLVAAVTPVLALACSGGVGRWPAGWLVAVVTAAGVGFAVWPESGLGGAAQLVVLVWWGLGVGEDSPAMSGWLLGAAAALLAGHLAALLAAYGPGRMPLARPVLRRWAPRAAGAYLVAVLVWTVGRAVTGVAAPELLGVLGLAATLAALVVAGVLFDRAGDGQPD